MDVDNSEQIDIETKIADLDSNDDEIYANQCRIKYDPHGCSHRSRCNGCG